VLLKLLLLPLLLLLLGCWDDEDDDEDEDGGKLAKGESLPLLAAFVVGVLLSMEDGDVIIIVAAVELIIVAYK